MIKNRSWILTTALAGAVLLCWQCREKTPTPEPTTEVIQQTKPIPKVIKDLADFAELSVSDTSNIDLLMSFKEIDSNGTVHQIDIDQAASAFKKKMTSKKSTSFPVVEITDSQKIVIILQGKGYGGPIWAWLLVNKGNQQIDKLLFDHSAETDGYGAAMTYNSFESQFTAKVISGDVPIFGLKQNDELLIKGTYEVDGLAGATITSQAVLEMMNTGLDTYKVYLESEKK